MCVVFTWNWFILIHNWMRNKLPLEYEWSCNSTRIQVHLTTHYKFVYWNTLCSTHIVFSCSWMRIKVATWIRNKLQLKSKSSCVWIWIQNTHEEFFDFVLKCNLFLCSRCNWIRIQLQLKTHQVATQFAQGQVHRGGYSRRAGTDTRCSCWRPSRICSIIFSIGCNRTRCAQQRHARLRESKPISSL